MKPLLSLNSFSWCFRKCKIDNKHKNGIQLRINIPSIALKIQKPTKEIANYLHLIELLLKELNYSIQYIFRTIKCF